MKIIKLVWPTLLILMLFFSNACNKNETKCDGYVSRLDEIGFSFSLIDEDTRETVIAAWGTEYYYEDIEFKQVMKDSVLGLKIYEDGLFFFDFIEEIGTHNLDEIVNKPFTNTYHLHLNAKNEDKETDIDTIVISSVVLPSDKDCVTYEFGHTTVTYNDSIYNEGEYMEHIDFIKKP